MKEYLSGMIGGIIMKDETIKALITKFFRVAIMIAVLMIVSRFM